MLCQDCNEHPAVIMFTHIVNNEKTVLHLCRECAEKRGLQTSLTGTHFSLGDLLAGMAEEGGSPEEEKMEKVSCQACGLTYSDFKKSARLGCSQCYESFADGLKGLLRKIHGSNQHLGKIPLVERDSFELKKEIRRLRENMKKAIQAEDFERAAALRDTIGEMEKAWPKKR